MIIELLQKKENLTTNESLLCQYILEHFDEFSALTLRELASRSYVSPPTVTRLCHKFGFKNYMDFKVQLVSEYSERKKQLTQINSNMPIRREDNDQQVVEAIAKISRDAIDIAQKDFDYGLVKKVANEIERVKCVDIYATGLSSYTAKIFAERMTRIGYITTVCTGSEATIRARQSDPKRVFAIVITYSNETNRAKRCINYLCESGVKKLLITGNKLGVSVPKSEYVYLMLSDEHMLMENKIDALEEIMMLHFILDAIYALVFHRNYDKNMQKIKETSNYQKEAK